MDFKDELVYAGQFNTDLGYPIVGNAASSIHQGIEASASARFGGPRLQLITPEDNFSGPNERSFVTEHPELVIDANASLSDNHFVHYTEHYGPTAADDYSYDGNTIGFFPELMGNVTMRGEWRGATVALETQSVGRIFLDNTGSNDASIGPRTLFHLNAGYRVPLRGGGAVAASVRVFNLLNRRYATSGYMDYDAGGNLVPQFIPAATRHWLGELRFEF
jgi:hypothetical protein